jgi:hypothetical protein
MWLSHRCINRYWACFSPAIKEINLTNVFRLYNGGVRLVLVEGWVLCGDMDTLGAFIRGLTNDHKTGA